MLEMIAVRFKEGGPFMWVILGVLAVACAVIVERLLFYFIICRRKGVLLVSHIARALNDGNLEEAHKAVAHGSAPVTALLRTAVEGYDNGLHAADIQESVEEAAIRELPRMSTRLNYLSLFANVATLLGLLGTIAGLQVSFSSLAAAEAAKKATMLAAGISQAMNTTAFGLIVAVPCMIMYTILANKRDRLLKELDEAVVRLMNYLKKKRP